MSAFCRFRSAFVALGSDRSWREAGGQPSIRAAAICGLELQRREDRRRKSIETDHPGCFLKYSGRRKTGPTGEFCP
jgi:hypothetical protein